MPRQPAARSCYRRQIADGGCRRETGRIGPHTVFIEIEKRESDATDCNYRGTWRRKKFPDCGADQIDSRNVVVPDCGPRLRSAKSGYGSALLGDRLRLAEFIPSDDLFIRSLATPSGLQGVAQHLDVLERILEWAQFDLLIVETVGIGQGEIAVRSVADQVVLVLQPQTGDSVQWDKAGLWELADVVVVQKCDLPGADGMLASLREQLTRPDGTSPSILGVSSHSKSGWKELVDCLNPCSALR